MNTIKNINKLTGIIPDSQIARLEAGAALHLRHSNISFKIIEANDTEIHVRTEQGKHLSENYATTHALVTLTRELFERFLPGKTIFTHPIKYQRPITSVVDTSWIADKMLKKGVRIKDIETDTGISKSNISNWLSGDKPMSQIVKAMFYFYFTR
jgi:hypothetical protein